MIIEDKYRQSERFIIVRRDHDDEEYGFPTYSTYSITVELAGHAVTNNAVVFPSQNIKLFLSSVSEFTKCRSGKLALEGTEDFRLAFIKEGHNADVWIGCDLFVTLTGIFSLSPSPNDEKSNTFGTVGITGGISVSAESIQDIIGKLALLLSEDAVMLNQKNASDRKPVR
jgi:hypothetical protein